MRLFFLVVLSIFANLFYPPLSFAIENPLNTPNNKIGIHILFPSELEKAAALVNSSGGDWGYVTIPIQATDRDLVKWQLFMNQAKKLHLIPIIRLATSGDYFKQAVWRKPTDADIMDFANFLGSLSWPVKNRYVVIFNEVNRGDEWGGIVNPAEYASLLSYAVTVFKTVSPDFFLISAGLDNAAPNKMENGVQTFMNEYEYMRQMNIAVPNIFSQVDGLASHAYPNPGFSTPPTYQGTESIASFRYERSLAEGMGSKPLPVFITETGWSKDAVGNLAAGYLQQAVTTVWSDPGVVAITPFLLQAADGPFKKFSFLNPDSSITAIYNALYSLPKTKGIPIQEAVLAEHTTLNQVLKTRSFSQRNKIIKSKISLSQAMEDTFKWIMKL